MKREERIEQVKRLRTFEYDADSLRRNQEMVMAILNACTEAALLIDLNDTVLAVNSVTAQRLGTSAEEMIGHNVYDFLSPEVRENRKFQTDQVAKTGKAVRFEDERDGQVIDNSVHPVFDGAGKVVWLAIFGTDITEYKRTEEQLQIFKHCIDLSPEAVCQIDPQGRLLYVNDSACEALGYRREELLQMAVWDIDAALTPELWAEAWPEVKKRGSSTEQRTYRRKYGSTFPVEITLSYFNVGGQEYHWAFAKDITSRKNAEAAIAQSETKFSRAFYDSASSFAITSLGEGRFVDINESFSQSSGYTRDEVIGHTAQELGMWSDPEQRARLRALLEEQGHVRNFEYPCRYKTGEVRYGLMSASIIRIDGQDCILSEVTDITDRKRAEEHLAYQAQLLDKVSDAVVSTDEAFRVRSWNKAAEEIYGWKEEEALGRDPYDLLRAEFIGMSQEDADRRLRENGAVQVELFHHDRLGRRLVIDAKVSVLKDAQGRMTGTLGVLRDTTERKQMEEALRRSHDELEQRVNERTRDLEQSNVILRGEVERRKKAEHEFRTLSDNAPDIIMRFDRECRHRYINPAYKRVYGLSPDAFLGKTVLEIGLPQALAGLLHDTLIRVITKAEVLEFEFERPSPHGIKQISTHVGPVFASDGTVDSALVISRDVTEKHQLEQMVHERQRMEAVGTLAGGIAHDFNNMLAVIMGNAELALDDESLEDVHANLAQILHASRRSRDLVKQILTFSRRSEGQRKPMSLTPLVKETASFLRGTLPSTISIKVSIRTESDTILGNSSQVQQVVMNLATNAAQAMGENGGTLAIHLSEVMLREGDRMPDGDLKPGRYLKLTLRDTGNGIPSDIRARIFEPFFTTKGPGVGTGMGLAVVFGIVKGHGGAVSVASKVGKGSVFTVFLPAVGETPSAESVTTPLLRIGNERVLVIDDETSVLRVVSATLEKLGYTVTTARSGPEGWKKFEHDPYRFDVVITDQIMPEMTGMKLAERMLGVRPDLPIILATGYSETVSAEEAKSAGISEFLMKPIERRTLADVVRSVLDKRKPDSAD